MSNYVHVQCKVGSLQIPQHHTLAEKMDIEANIQNSPQSVYVKAWTVKFSDHRDKYALPSAFGIF